ncbi:TIGR03618 family F420-dependent PPOX class oxidoreductase [Streptomyces sp. NPDC050610]|uniref:TIGR03618 family F420-dependent PPOX class oxidoreductase n=1 Tax=Streptomyces sp. NPDC050610 TaxID=3157097 RepID=UPI00342D610C
MPLPPELIHILRAPALCFVTTLMPDGSPQITQTWVDTDEEHILVNTVTTHQKMRNIERDPRVAVAIAAPEAPSRYWGARGKVTSSTLQGAGEHIDTLSHKYLGRPYPGFGGGPQQRVILSISVEKLHTPGA